MMAASINSSPVHGERDLLGQTVVVIGGSSGIGLETARLARARGADIILTARNPDRHAPRAAPNEPWYRVVARYRLKRQLAGLRSGRRGKDSVGSDSSPDDV